MRLLKITDSRSLEQLDQYFGEAEEVDLESVTPQVVDNSQDVKVKGSSVEGFDAVYADIPVENAVFGRVLLEVVEEKGIPVNYSSTAFFAMSKKNYLYHVLHEKDIPAPRTAVAADEKAVRNLENYLKGPLVARKFNGLSEVESKKISTVEEIENFAEGVEYGDNFLLFQEYASGDKYRCLVAGDSVLSLEDSSDSWKVGEDKLRYSNLSENVRANVVSVKKALGTKTAEVLVRGGQVVDVNPNPDLDIYSVKSGKDAYQRIAEAIKEGV